MHTWLHQPPAPLGEYVEYFFLYEGLVASHTWERFLPDGHIELIIDLRENANQWCWGDRLDEAASIRGGWISGVHRQFITIRTVEGASMLVVRFRPGRIAPFLPLPAGEIAGQVVALADLWGPAFSTLRQQILDQPTAEGKFAAVENFLYRQLRRAEASNPVVDFAIRQLQTLETGAGIASLAAKTGYTHKHFVSLFHRHIGVSPKAYSRILKFQQAVQQLEKTSAPDWSRLVYTCGYYDQAHFINEFKHFSGFSPSFYLKKRGVYLNYLPMD